MDQGKCGSLPSTAIPSARLYARRPLDLSSLKSLWSRSRELRGSTEPKAGGSACHEPDREICQATDKQPARLRLLGLRCTNCRPVADLLHRASIVEHVARE